MPIINVCKTCNQSFTVSPSHASQKFCSSTCYGISQRGRNICQIEGCGGFVMGKNLCNKHYLRYKRYGSPFKFSPKAPAQRDKNARKVFSLTCLQCGKIIDNPTYTRKYCSWQCAGLANRNSFIIKKGYKKILIPNHPRADKKGYVFEHILILNEKMGRPLNAGEVCHHIDCNKLNNHPDNLTVFISNSEHITHHFLTQNVADQDEVYHSYL